MASIFFRQGLRTANIKKLSARYQPYITDHATWPKPFNTLDNADPARFDKSIVDESDSTAKKFLPGDKPPLAYQATKEFPDWYKPYLLNYFGHGFLIVTTAFLFVLVWIQDQETKRLHGRRKLKEFRNEAKRIGGYSVRSKHAQYKLTLPDPQIEYMRRYINESGF